MVFRRSEYENILVQPTILRFAGGYTCRGIGEEICGYYPGTLQNRGFEERSTHPAGKEHGGVYDGEGLRFRGEEAAPHTSSGGRFRERRIFSFLQPHNHASRKRRIAGYVTPPRGVVIIGNLAEKLDGYGSGCRRRRMGILSYIRNVSRREAFRVSIAACAAIAVILYSCSADSHFSYLDMSMEQLSNVAVEQEVFISFEDNKALSHLVSLDIEELSKVHVKEDDHVEKI